MSLQLQKSFVIFDINVPTSVISSEMLQMFQNIIQYNYGASSINAGNV